jgi:hypothetical protein
LHIAHGCVEDARAANHAMTLCYALMHAACPIALWSGDLAAAEHYVRMLLDRSTRPALTLWRAFGQSYQEVLVNARWAFGDAIEDCSQDPAFRTADRAYFASMIEAGNIDEALPDEGAAEEEPVSTIDVLLRRSAVYREADPLLDSMQQFAGRWSAGFIEMAHEKAHHHGSEARGIFSEQI